MRILYISDPITIGGASNSLLDIVTEMTKRNVECVVCLSKVDCYSKKLHDIGASYIITNHMAVMEVASKKRIKKPLVFLYRKLLYKNRINIAIKNIEKQIDMSSIDIIHTNSARNDLGGILAQKYNIPHIVHIREFGDLDFDCWCYRKNYIDFLNDTTTKFIAISKAVKEYWIKKGLEEEKVIVIYNGVNNEIIKEKDYNLILNDELKIVIVGGICEAKGQMQIFKALSIIPPKIQKHISVSIIGWGNKDYINELKSISTNNKILSHIEFLGPRDDVYELLHSFDVGLMCSRAEGFGRVTIEYMHAGLAVIASDTGANKEIIKDGETGLIYKYNHIEDLASKILELYSHRNKIQVIGKKGQGYVRKYFTKEINANNILSQYLALTDGNGR